MVAEKAVMVGTGIHVYIREKVIVICGLVLGHTAVMTPIGMHTYNDTMVLQVHVHVWCCCIALDRSQI